MNTFSKRSTIGQALGEGGGNAPSLQKKDDKGTIIELDTATSQSELEYSPHSG